MFCLYFIEKRDFDWGGAKWLSGGGGTIGAYIVKKCPDLTPHRLYATQARTRILCHTGFMQHRLELES